MRRPTRLLTIGWFLVLLAIPGFATIWSDRDQIANRPVTAAPPVDAGDLLDGDYFDVLDRYLEDRLSIRERAIETNAGIAYEVFGDSTNAAVLVGRDRWLFVTGTFELPCRSQAAQTWPAPDRVTRRLATLADALEPQGASLYFTVIPEKAWVYPAELPGAVPYRDCAVPLIDDLRTALEAEAGYVDVFGFLQDRVQTDPEQLYQYTDTHWTNYGRTVASEFIVEAFAPGTYNRDELLVGDVVEKPDGGDLAALLGYGIADEDVRITPQRPNAVQVTVDAPGRQREWESVGNGDPLVPGRTLIVTDSHINTSANQLAPWFESLRIVPWQDLDHPSVRDEVRRADRVLLAFSARFSAERLTSFSRVLHRYLTE